MVAIFLLCFILVPFLLVNAGWKACQNQRKSSDNIEIIYFVLGVILYLVQIALLIFIIKSK